MTAENIVTTILLSNDGAKNLFEITHNKLNLWTRFFSSMGKKKNKISSGCKVAHLEKRSLNHVVAIFFIPSGVSRRVSRGFNWKASRESGARATPCRNAPAAL